MKSAIKKIFVLTGCVLLLVTSMRAQRACLNLSETLWNITLDRSAVWQNDSLYVPPVNIHDLPVHIPTGGWNLLDTPDKIGVTLPATVEQHLWGWNGETFGVTGNYVGVSWFDTKINVPADWRNKRIVMNVASVRFRAEIFVNKKLVGYDLVNSTPFAVDVTPFILPGQENVIAFRITDPNGNFNWKDSQVYTWGEYRTNPSHGFGGITGKVELVATDKLYIGDVFIKNQPDPHSIEVEVTACNETKNPMKAQKMLLTVKEHKGEKVLYRKEYSVENLVVGENKQTFHIHLPAAKLWSTDSPHLYDLSVSVGTDNYTQRFGFRWFEVKDIHGDKQFFLNGKRIVLRTAISWSFWPDNGITPSDELARRQVESAKKLGLNMLNFHRTIGHSNVLDYADELGLLYFEEPGGNQYPISHFNDNNKQSKFYFAYRNEKLVRMIKRDRNHPSLVIYNLHNERGAWPQVQDYAQMRMAHSLDPTRILTYNSSNGENPENEANARFKLHLMHSNVLDYADELGLLYFEEPGGNQYPISHFNDNNKQSKFYFAYRNEKLVRMIKRDRNHPSLVIYNLHNERGAWPQVQDYAQMRMAHSLDPTRILTYNSSNGENPENEANARFKLHLMPNDTTFYDYGWYDRHHAGGPGCYHDNLYWGKDNYHRFSDHKDEIIYWGEDGAIGTPPRLQLIRDEILQSGTTSGWEAMDYMKWYDAYDSFLKHNGFAKAFPTVDDLTRAMGNVAFYYQGRVIENIRISNTVDAYAVNGWESMKLENHSGIVDNYRYPKGDVEVMARYNQPLFLAVKMNRKVLNVGDTTIVDTYIVNEKNLKGNYSLQLIAKDAEGTVLATHVSSVHVKGGNVYGQCLQIGWNFVPRATGYVCIEAKLVKGKKTFATGDDSLFAVSLNTKGITANGSIADTTGVLSNFMKTVGFDIPEYKEGTPSGDYLLVGAFEPTQWGSGMSDIMEWVYKGHTLIIVDNAERWAEFLADKEVLDYRGSKKLGTAWYGGNFFNREHPIFDGLPVNCVFNWEYQCFATYNRHRVGLRCFNGETLVACVSDHKKEVYSALSVIPAGRGKIIITTLDIPACIKDVKAYTVPVDLDGMNESMNTFNTKSENRANVVGQQLLLNLIKESNR